MKKKYLSIILCLSMIITLGSSGLVSTASTVLPGDELGGIRYELEDGKLIGNAQNVLNNTSIFNDFGGDGYVYLGETGDAVSLDIDVQESGNYEVYIVGGAVGNGRKCEKVYINDEPVWLTVPYEGDGVWNVCTIGSETYNGGIFDVSPVTGGHFFAKGKNTVKIDVFWGYASYDSIILVPIDK
ncbi:MAG: hypothetical protein PHH84_06140 [Oscillospiraceae bacterium]|nr:hypothetical protein [Oscillospiraceae bacterium]MDD4413103.1 hypothetical protein [Oscillospiraceae bacterium]